MTRAVATEAVEHDLFMQVVELDLEPHAEPAFVQFDLLLELELDEVLLQLLLEVLVQALKILALRAGKTEDDATARGLAVLVDGDLDQATALGCLGDLRRGDGAPADDRGLCTFDRGDLGSDDGVERGRSRHLTLNVGQGAQAQPAVLALLTSHQGDAHAIARVETLQVLHRTFVARAHGLAGDLQDQVARFEASAIRRAAVHDPRDADAAFFLAHVDAEVAPVVLGSCVLDGRQRDRRSRHHGDHASDRRAGCCRNDTHREGAGDCGCGRVLSRGGRGQDGGREEGAGEQQVALHEEYGMVGKGGRGGPAQPRLGRSVRGEDAATRTWKDRNAGEERRRNPIVERNPEPVGPGLPGMGSPVPI